MKVAVIGAGAVGLGIGAGLAANGVSVRFVINRPAQRRALATQGVSRSGLFGDLEVAPSDFSIADSIDALADWPADHWLVCTKSTASRELVKQIAPVWRRMPTKPSVVLCQNGWGNAEVFATQIPPRHVFNARVITGFVRNNETHIRVTAHADSIHIGSLFGASTQELAELTEAITRGGIPCEISQEIDKDLWAKMLYNGLLNPLGALVGVPYGVLAERDETRAIMKALAHEIFDVMRAADYSTHWQSADDYLTTFYQDLLPPTAEHQSSMLQDLQAGRMTEVEGLCGALCELAAAHHVPAPLNDALLTLIRVAEARAST